MEALNTLSATGNSPVSSVTPDAHAGSRRASRMVQLGQRNLIWKLSRILSKRETFWLTFPYANTQVNSVGVQAND
jgi:hypothetical protein